MLRPISFNESKLETILEEVLKEFSLGEPVILPTDTLYGLASPLSRPVSVRRIFHIKKRPEEMTLPVALGSLEQVHEVAHITDKVEDHIKRYLPGPYTFVLKAKNGMPGEVIRNGTVAVRVPDHPIYKMICSRVGPLALTSANIHGREPVLTLEDADEQLKGFDLLFVEDRKRIDGHPSEIVDLTNGVPILLRKGNVNIEENMRGQHG